MGRRDEYDTDHIDAHEKIERLLRPINGGKNAFPATGEASAAPQTTPPRTAASKNPAPAAPIAAPVTPRPVPSDTVAVISSEGHVLPISVSPEKMAQLAETPLPAQKLNGKAQSGQAWMARSAKLPRTIPRGQAARIMEISQKFGLAPNQARHVDQKPWLKSWLTRTQQVPEAQMFVSEISFFQSMGRQTYMIRIESPLAPAEAAILRVCDADDKGLVQQEPKQDIFKKGFRQLLQPEAHRPKTADNPTGATVDVLKT